MITKRGAIFLIIITLFLVGCNQLHAMMDKSDDDNAVPIVPWVTPEPLHHTVFLIVMENTNWSEIQGNTHNAPYINQRLLPEASYATQYYNPPRLHPSEPNYLWLEAGTNFTVTTDEEPSVNHVNSPLHLVTLLDKQGISWRSYQEGITGTDCPLKRVGQYVPRHNPMLYFDDVTDGNNPQSANCIRHVRPMTELAPDLAQDTVARYNFIIPNLCNDMHDDPKCFSVNRYSKGDDWLEDHVPKILASPAFSNGAVLFITWDEGEGINDGPIGLIVLSRYAKGGGYSNAIHYTHSSLLRTIQEIFGVYPLLGDAANATDLRDLFAIFP